MKRGMQFSLSGMFIGMLLIGVFMVIFGTVFTEAVLQGEKDHIEYFNDIIDGAQYDQFEQNLEQAKNDSSLGEESDGGAVSSFFTGLRTSISGISNAYDQFSFYKNISAQGTQILTSEANYAPWRLIFSTMSLLIAIGLIFGIVLSVLARKDL
jgi:hypothetical protein